MNKSAVNACLRATYLSISILELTPLLRSGGLCGLAKTELALFGSTMRPSVQTQHADPLNLVALGVLRPLACGKAANCRSQNDAAPEVVASSGLLGHHNHIFRKAI